LAETTWLYRVALNTALAWSRKERRHRGRTELLNGTEPALRMTEHRPDRRLGWLYEQIAQLDYVDRSLTLLLLDGFSYRDMAETLGITESNVGVKINRIKAHFTKLSQEGTHDGL
jgi:RNA polymerase sigma-70 factor (ECF subfamily)